MTVDAFSRGALIVDPVVEWSVAVQCDAHLPAHFPVDILDTAFPFGELGMIAVRAGGLRKEQGTAEAEGAIAIGMVELEGGLHAQFFGTDRGPISGPLVERVGMLVEWDGSDAAMEGSTLVDILGVKGRIGRHVGGIHP